MRCPVCGDEYEDGVVACVDCRVPLTAGAGPFRPRLDGLLGRFDPALAEPVTALLERRGVAYQVLSAGEDVEVLVERSRRGDLRAELALTWPDLVAGVDDAERLRLVSETSGNLPGWRDAPEGAWVDRRGRLQVAPSPQEEAEEDARRVAGPSLITLGVFLVLLGWYAGGSFSELSIVVGLALTVTGALLPR